jgi:hypothetical protein
MVIYGNSKLMYQKQKIVVFSKKKSNQNFSYEMFGEKISQQDDYNYLGLVDQAQQALYSLYLSKFIIFRIEII